MGEKQLLAGVLTGAVVMAIGLTPGLLQDFWAGVDNACERLSREWFSQYPQRLHTRMDYPDVHTPVWLAPLGAAMIVLAVFTYARI